METKTTEKNTLVKKAFRFLRSRKQKNNAKNNSVEATARMNGRSGSKAVSCSNGDGVVRMKIVVRKQDLEGLVEELRRGKRINNDMKQFVSDAEQLLNLLKRNH